MKLKVDETGLNGKPINPIDKYVDEDELFVDERWTDFDLAHPSRHLTSPQIPSSVVDMIGDEAVWQYRQRVDGFVFTTVLNECYVNQNNSFEEFEYYCDSMDTDARLAYSVTPIKEEGNVSGINEPDIHQSIDNQPIHISEKPKPPIADDLKGRWEKIIKQVQGNRPDIEDLSAKDIVSLMTSAYQMDRDKWVSVTDRLPEKDGQFNVCYQIADSGWAVYNTSYSSLCKRFYMGNSLITHWQPLPSPPNK